MNIPRYVDVNDDEEEVDLRQLSEHIRETDRAIKARNNTLLKMLGELAFADPGTKNAVEEFINVFREV